MHKYITCISINSINSADHIIKTVLTNNIVKLALTSYTIFTVLFIFPCNRDRSKDHTNNTHWCNYSRKGTPQQPPAKSK